MGTAAGIMAVIRQLSGMGKGRVKEMYEWGQENPRAFSNYLMGWAHFAEHRYTVLNARRTVWRKRVRLARLKSAAEELREFVGEIDARGELP